MKRPDPTACALTAQLSLGGWQRGDGSISHEEGIGPQTPGHVWNALPLCVSWEELRCPIVHPSLVGLMAANPEGSLNVGVQVVERCGELWLCLIEIVEKSDSQ